MQRTEFKRYTLLGKLVVTQGKTEQRVRDVAIYPLKHADRVAAEKHAPTDIDAQDDYLLHLMTGLPLEAIDLLSFADAEKLLIEMGAMSRSATAAGTLPETIAPGYQYPLTEPLDTPMGVLTKLTLRELTRGDQRRAGQISALSTEQTSVLIGAMAGLQLEDVANLSFADSWALERFFRRIVDTGEANAGSGSGAAANPPGFEPGLPVPDAA